MVELNGTEDWKVIASFLPVSQSLLRTSVCCDSLCVYVCMVIAHVLNVLE